ncbi:MAG: hypothetical protein IJX19_07295 [Clostridia bacterium]|nr:hypothetical protein [Clostridia bacterium]
MSLLNGKTVNRKNAMIVIAICLVSVFYVLWQFVDACLYMRDAFMFPFFQPNWVWIMELIVILLLFAAMLLFAKAVVFVSLPQQDEKREKRKMIPWFGLVGSSFLFLVVGTLMTITMSFICIGQTNDLDHYLIFDPAVSEQDVLAMFPSKEEVDLYVETGADVSYEYVLERGVFGSESTYSIVLDVKSIDEQRYQKLKTDLIQTYNEKAEALNGKLRIPIDITSQADLDGFVFSVVYLIECDDETSSITYSAVKAYN